ncbi:hypothetical protein [Cohnella abietis]|uniref:Uncharacterized protein n=1 Tax=Cohnella abietis TaxID=2507935 RepID=A0A3T1D4Z1_9BACL|nr:hypothetical protein [Cohnella abietis]BBI33045.1 hypothetical protein KCTCHS21_24440 [Cohnella abietis]
MSSFFDSGPLPDWKEIQEWLGKDIPWKLAEKWDQGDEGNSNWLNHYVKNILQKSKQEAKVKSQSSIRMETKQEAKYVNVTIHLTPEVQLNRLRIYATTDRLKLAGLPDDMKQSIRFPCLVFPRTGRAVMKKDQLHIRFRRRPAEKSEYELFIDS